MILRGVTAGLLLLVSTALAQSAQSNFGTITGTLTNPDNGVIVGAIVQARQITSGKVYKTETVRGGTFTLSQLPAGTYELSVPEVGFLVNAYKKKDLGVQAGQTVRHDIRLDWQNLGVVGDDMYLDVHNRNRSKKLTGRTPRTSSGKPDLTGVWLGSRDTNPEEAEALPWVGDVMKERVANNFRDLPGADCLVADIVPSAPLLYKIIQTPSLIVQLFESDPHFRQIFMDGRPHPKNPDPTWTGHSVGKWEGDTLVIDTVGFNDKGWLPNLMPHTDKLHVVERYSRPDLSHLNVEITMEDPGTLKKPWHIHFVWELTPDDEIPEYVCNENNHFRELAGEK